jgi:membrane protein YqaA with SNARE-associated domain
MEGDLTLWGVFLSAFVSSTLLPGGSEVILAALAAQEGSDRITLLAVASAGNTLGGMSSWLIGRLIAMRFPARELTKPKHRQAIDRVQQWGSPVLLLSWLPVIGDPLCVAAGWLKTGFVAALVFIAVGKTLRYAVIVWLV